MNTAWGKVSPAKQVASKNSPATRRGLGRVSEYSLEAVLAAKSLYYRNGASKYLDSWGGR